MCQLQMHLCKLCSTISELVQRPSDGVIKFLREIIKHGSVYGRVELSLLLLLPSGNLLKSLDDDYCYGKSRYSCARKEFLDQLGFMMITRLGLRSAIA